MSRDLVCMCRDLGCLCKAKRSWLYVSRYLGCTCQEILVVWRRDLGYMCQEILVVCVKRSTGLEFVTKYSFLWDRHIVLDGLAAGYILGVNIEQVLTRIIR